MIQSSTLQFIKDLAVNNNKPWFDANKERFENAKKDFEEFVNEVLSGLGKADSAYKEIAAKDCIFRIYRDVRFSKDKTPYKSHFGAHINKGGKKMNNAAFYMHLEPGKCFAGGGMWMPEADKLKAIRQEIDYNFPAFKEIVDEPKFVALFGKLEGEQLKSVPKGYEATNPAAEYLKMKSFVASHQISDEVLMSPGATKKCVEVYNTMQPLIDFLNKAID